MDRILVVEDRESLAQMLRESLESEGFRVECAPNRKAGLECVRGGDRFVAILTDLRLPDGEGIDILKESREVDPECPVIVMTGFGTVENAVDAMKLGAFDFIQKPIDIDHLLILLRRCQDHRRLRHENIVLREEHQKRYGLPEIVGDSEGLKRVSQQLQKVAETTSTVLLLGESGTGKELFARALHRLSARRDRAFVALNCAAIPDTLIENELFGHEKGSYTGAVSRQIGKFELADGGTLFLDEIGELGLGVQSKVLRVIEEKAFERIGGSNTIHADVRIVCATNRDLGEAVRAGRFREDLFFRINVFPITAPPLRSRREDIVALTDHFLQKFGREMGKPASIRDGARAALAEYDWPGNVRELENCIERAVILADRGVIQVGDLLLPSKTVGTEEKLREVMDFNGTLPEVTARAAALAEKVKIQEALRAHPDREAAARSLGISERVLSARIREHGLAK